MIDRTVDGEVEMPGARLSVFAGPANLGKFDPIPVGPLRRVVSADPTDDDLVARWLFGKNPRTVRAYRRTLNDLRAFACGLPFCEMTIGDLQAFADTMTCSVNSRRTSLYAVKSFFRFSHATGALAQNVAHELAVGKQRATVQERILTEDHVAIMFETASGRDALYVRFLYASALRVSESVSVRWSDFAPVDRGEVVVTVFGKNDKTRNVRLDADTWAALVAYRGAAMPTDYVWPFGADYARKRIRLLRHRAALDRPASPHWFRHAHASHYIAAGGQLDVLQRTLGHATLETTSVYLHARPRECSARSLALLKSRP